MRQRFEVADGDEVSGFGLEKINFNLVAMVFPRGCKGQSKITEMRERVEN